MTTARECFLIFTAGVLFASTACADNFKCDQAARFGYVDPLCDPLQMRITPIVPFARSDAIKDSPPSSAGDPRPTAANQAEIYRQSARANQRAWDNYGAWNPASPVFPRGTFPGGEWSPLKFPPVGFPELSASPSAQEGRAIKH